MVKLTFVERREVDSNSMILIKETIHMAGMFASAIIGALITGIFLIIAAFIAYKFGLRTYFKKREHEQIMKRYLDESIDRASACFDHATGVFIDNYRTALRIIREIKIGTEVDLSLITFSKFEQIYFDITPWTKINILVGDTIFWRFFQLLCLFVDNKTIWFDVDFRSTVEQVLGGEIAISKETLLSEIKNKLDEFYIESRKYALILRELQFMASIFEKETSLTWADLSEFKNRPEIKTSVKRLHKEFSEIKDKNTKDVQKE